MNKTHIHTSRGPLCGADSTTMTANPTKSDCKRCYTSSLCEDCGGPKGRVNTFCIRCAGSMEMEMAEQAEMRRKKLTEQPCPRCIKLAIEGKLRTETVQRLPSGAWAPEAQDRSGPCCWDCAAADALTRLSGMNFEMARIAVANDRQEQYRLPGAPMGLVAQGLVQPSAPGDFEDQLAWLQAQPWYQEPI